MVAQLRAKFEGAMGSAVVGDRFKSAYSMLDPPKDDNGH